MRKTYLVKSVEYTTDKEVGLNSKGEYILLDVAIYDKVSKECTKADKVYIRENKIESIFIRDINSINDNKPSAVNEDIKTDEKLYENLDNKIIMNNIKDIKQQAKQRDINLITLDDIVNYLNTEKHGIKSETCMYPTYSSKCKSCDRGGNDSKGFYCKKYIV